MTETPTPSPSTKGENERRILRRDPNPKLLSPFRLRSVTTRNRIMLSPMCQYSAQDGVPNDWHLVHLGARAVGGTGIVFTESVHSEPRGRITPSCLGLWNDAQQEAFARIVRFVEAQGAVAAIQIGHSGRKGSTMRPWEGGKPVSESEGGWKTIAPSPLPFAKGYPVPEEMDLATVRDAIEATAASAKRARQAGFRIVEVHAAHGYLINQFLSPLSNRRSDVYGGDFANRCRFLMETIDAVRGVWPDDLPLFVRLSCTEWVKGGWDMEQSIALCKQLKARGDVDLIDCTSGGNDPRQKIPIYPGYQIKMSETVRRETGLPTSAVGLLHSPDLAEEVIASGRADLVALGRALMADPHWPLQAANALKATSLDWPIQYERSNIY